MKSNIEFHDYIESSISTLKIGFTHPHHDPAYFKGREIYQSLLFCTAEKKLLMKKNLRNLTLFAGMNFQLMFSQKVDQKREELRP